MIQFKLLQFRLQAKEKISDAARQTGEEGFFNPSTLEQVIKSSLKKKLIKEKLSAIIEVSLQF